MIKDLKTIMELRKQAVRVGLVNAKTLRNLVFCSESEASALHCVSEVHSGLQGSTSADDVHLSTKRQSA